FNEWLKELVATTQSLTWSKRALISFGFSILGWIFEYYSLLVLTQPFGFTLSFSQGLFILSILNLGIAVPVSLGNLGLYEGALTLGLSFYDVPLETALLISLLHHFLQVLAVTLLLQLYWILN